VPTPTATPTPTNLPTPLPTGTATPSPGGTPTSLVDAFKCYVAVVRTGTPPFTPVDGVSLVDSLESVTTRVVRPRRYCDRVHLGGNETPETSMTCYELQDHPGGRLHSTELQISDPFGSRSVQLVGESSERLLCEPSLTNDAGTLDQAGRYRCLRARLARPSLPLVGPDLTIVDRIETKRMRVRSLRNICLPVTKDGEPPRDDATVLACYNLSQRVGQRPFLPSASARLDVRSELGASRLALRNGQRTLCVPAVMTPQYGP
jgi:hypothetical protein